MKRKKGINDGKIIKIQSEMMTVEEFKKQVREAVANYMRSEGCSCCQDWDEHKKNKKRLGELLDCGKYDGEDEYDFWQYATKRS